MVIYKNYDDLPKIELPLGQEVFISDSTIRDGSQMPGVVMKRRHKLKIYEFLHEIGIEKLETFVFQKRDRDAIKAMQDIGYDDSHIFDKMQLNSREEASERYLDALQYAVDHGLRTRAHLEDVTRADMQGFVYPLVKDIVAIDPDCTVRLCDTLGFAVPFADACEPYSIRSGNTELEKILLFLVRRVGGFEKYDLSCMVRFAEYMEQHIGIRIPRNKAIVGRNVFVHESGIHTAGVIKNPFTYEPYPPEIIGAERQLLIGDSSGREVVRHKVEEALHELMQVKVSIEKNDPRIVEIQKDIQQLYDEEERVSCISDEELTRYVEKYFMLAMIVDGEEVRDIVE
jgi:isopropylmalate/homocitrate/citramalate synthase